MFPEIRWGGEVTLAWRGIKNATRLVADEQKVGLRYQCRYGIGSVILTWLVSQVVQPPSGWSFWSSWVPHGRAHGRGQREEAGQVPGAGGRVQDGSGLESSLLGLRLWASEDSGLTLLGITSAVKMRTIRLATETPENVTRWLWIKMTRFVGNAVGHRLESPGEIGWCWMAPNTQWPQTSWMVSSSTSERPIFCQMHIGLKIWVKTKLFTCIQYYVNNVVQ